MIRTQKDSTIQILLTLAIVMMQATNSISTKVQHINTTALHDSAGQVEVTDTYEPLGSNIYTEFETLLAYANDSFNDTAYDASCYQGANTLGHIITTVLYATVCIIGLFGNTLVIYVVLRFAKMQTVTNIYILNLAIADECFLIGIPFLLYTMQIGSWKFGEYLCKAYMVSTSVTQFTSSIFLLIMAADRYIAVCHPIASQRYRTTRMSKLISCIAWATSVLLMLPVILFANIVHSIEDDEHISCNIKWPEEMHTQSGTTFILYSLSLGFATPLTFILIFYILVIYKLHTVGPKQKSKERKRSHRKVTKLVLTVITVYILCWLPYWISQVVLISTTPSPCVSKLEIMMFLLVGCLGYSNSAMNPLMYAFLSDNFKKCFMKAFTCLSKWHINAAHSVGGEQNILANWCGTNRKMTQKKSSLTHNNNVTTNLLTTSAAYGCATGQTATSTLADAISDVSMPDDDDNNCVVAAGTASNADISTDTIVAAKKEHLNDININLSNVMVLSHAPLAKSCLFNIKHDEDENENDDIEPSAAILYTDL